MKLQEYLHTITIYQKNKIGHIIHNKPIDFLNNLAELKLEEYTAFIAKGSKTLVWPAMPSVRKESALYFFYNGNETQKLELMPNQTIKDLILICNIPL